MKYTEADIPPLSNSLDFIQSRPEMFLPYGHPNGGSMAGVLVDEALALTGAKTNAFRINDWWGVSCEVDWIALAPQQTLKEFYQTFTPCPQWAINSIYFEVVLFVFADDLKSLTPQDTEVLPIKGNLPTSEEIQSAQQLATGWQRITLFRYRQPE